MWTAGRTEKFTTITNIRITEVVSNIPLRLNYMRVHFSKRKYQTFIDADKSSTF